MASWGTIYLHNGALGLFDLVASGSVAKRSLSAL
ncbi:hypothetical protein T4D_13403 [Trichinella pseudospiralis]|uniref:Uncharacterized protein n=1 Tax=Trichinella pseudospiralis TaxID=6337 RepID=A0A0V1DQW6_TRIPS|nr:hypothetical protein T4D_13403 [Trichinella pseudospiralis]